MRVLAVSSYPELGGAELALEAFLAHRPGHIDPIAVVLGSGPLTERLAAAGTPTFSAPGVVGRPTAEELARFGAGFRRLLLDVGPDVVWAVGIKAATMTVAPCRAVGVPLVWHKVDLSLDRTMAKPLALSVNGVISVSQAAADALGPRIRRMRLLGVVAPPITLSTELSAEPDPERPTIATLGSLYPLKGHHHLIRAAALLIDEFPELRVVIAGEEARGAKAQFAGYRAKLLQLAAELGISEHVELPGFIDPAPLLRRCSVLVNASYRQGAYGFEGLGAVMLEASWAGVPVVATRGGGSVESVIDGVTGTLTEPGDPAALAVAIGRYLRDPERSASTGAAGRRFARARFAPRIVAPMLFGHLESIGQAR